ncbi:phosphoribosyltransferase [Amnibacterium kyonggiense]|uniref:phosphoribosyltransferase n=1 Tax=Amnibacterium kyonggiense TaxID=595671 RepID=UPI001FEABE17|nr:phosphoribosyltransferase family protein [Amnibacterium kyonggiense]
MDAGRRLADALLDEPVDDAVVLGLPRGGVVVATEVARRLGAPLDVVVVRKLGLPTAPEVAMGAIGEGGVRLLDLDLVRRCGVTAEEVAEVERVEQALLDLRLQRFRNGPLPDLQHRTALLVDDGIATGATAAAACEVVRRAGAARVVLAAPVGARRVVAALRGPDVVVCPLQPDPFDAVGRWYGRFDEVTDADVVRLLRAAREHAGVPT